jgi:hypothetical protein
MIEPKNEMGVIVLFSQWCLNSEWEILSIQSAFPDGIIKNKNNEKLYKVEFEFLSSNFIQHGHNVFGCDILICWKDDSEIKIPTSIWELSNLKTDMLSFSDIEKEIFNLKIENASIKKKNKNLRMRLIELGDKYDENESIQLNHRGIILQTLDEIYKTSGDIPGVTEIARAIGEQQIDKGKLNADNLEAFVKNTKGNISEIRQEWLKMRNLS